MAKVTFILPIEELHGKIRKNFGAAQRSEANNEGERKPYTVFYGERKSQPSTSEVTARNKFKTLSLMYKARCNDETKIATDNAAFKAQSQYKTLRAYRWHKCMDELAASAS